MTDRFAGPNFETLVRALRNPKLVIGLAGPPGVGKTSLLFAIGKSLNKPYIGKVPCHSELSPGEIMGIPLPGAEDNWSAGPGDIAYKLGGMLILDELDKLSGACKTYAYSLLDKGPGGTVSYIGRTFKQHKKYQVVATMNENPTDGSLPEALLDRFDAWFFIMRPYEPLLKMLEPRLRDICVRSYNGAVDPMVGPSFTFRMCLGYQKLRETMSVEEALIGCTYGNTKLAQSVFEMMALQDDNEFDDTGEDDEEEESDEDDDDEEEEEEDDEDGEQDDEEE